MLTEGIKRSKRCLCLCNWSKMRGGRWQGGVSRRVLLYTQTHPLCGVVVCLYARIDLNPILESYSWILFLRQRTVACIVNWPLVWTLSETVAWNTCEHSVICLCVVVTECVSLSLSLSPVGHLPRRGRERHWGWWLYRLRGKLCIKLYFNIIIITSCVLRWIGHGIVVH